MRIKAVIFDLDDTLYDCTGLLVELSRRQAARAMVEEGLPLTVEEAHKLQEKMAEKFGPSFLVFDEIARMYGRGQELVKVALRAYNSSELSGIQPFPETIPTLKQLKLEKYKLFLVTSGLHDRQEKKINLLGIAPFFDQVLIHDQETDFRLEDCYKGLLKKYNLAADEVVVVGDRLDVELQVAKRLGMFAVQMLHGHHKMDPYLQNGEGPDYKIQKFYHLPTVLGLISMGKFPDKLRVVAVGGGTGLPMVLQGLKTYSKNLTALVAVTDSGRSSGKLRAEYGMLPPGDARNCLIALSETGEQQEDLYNLFQYRFNRGSLKGMSLGNLFMTALTDITGNFELALKKASKILAISGKVLPCTLQDTHICAELADGTTVQEEVNVRQIGKAPIRRVLLMDNHVEPLPEALKEIHSADIIVLGPGSLYTSVIPNILVEGLREAIKNSSATKIYVCNIVTQPGQTDGYTAADHINALTQHVGEGVLDYVLLNNRMPKKDMLEKYEREGAKMVRFDPTSNNLFVKIVETDLIEEPVESPRVLWEKQDLLRHDPDKLANAICRVYAKVPLPQTE